jgi:peptide/nickel transport system permease protein
VTGVGATLRLEALAHRLRRNLFVRGSLSSRRGIVGTVGVALLISLTIIGPFFSPYSPTGVVGLPLDGPSVSHFLGTDELGRDAFSRFLFGGRSLLAGTFLSTAIAYFLGIFVGMAAGYRRGVFELATVGAIDLLIAFPPLVLMLLLVAGAGTGLMVATLAIAAIQFPRVVRIVRAVTLEVSMQEFVEAAEARGERLTSILRREILPNIWNPVLADFGIRLASSALLFASLSYLGLGPAPPTADWGLMISENRDAIIVQPWIIVAPAAAIGFLTVTVNLAADSVARSIGRSTVARDV